MQWRNHSEATIRQIPVVIEGKGIGPGLNMNSPRNLENGLEANTLLAYVAASAGFRTLAHIANGSDMWLFEAIFIGINDDLIL
jgi:hypothetical protein